MILTAQSYHLKQLVALGEKYHKESPYLHTHPFESERLLDSLRRAMIVSSHNVVVAEIDGEVVGGCYAYLAPYAWCNSTRVNVELIYVVKEHRGHGLAEQMLEYQESWARNMGAQELCAGDIGLNPDLTEPWLERQGYTDTGILMRKVLAWAE